MATWPISTSVPVPAPSAVIKAPRVSSSGPSLFGSPVAAACNLTSMPASNMRTRSTITAASAASSLSSLSRKDSPIVRYASMAASRRSARRKASAPWLSTMNASGVFPATAARLFSSSDSAGMSTSAPEANSSMAKSNSISRASKAISASSCCCRVRQKVFSCFSISGTPNRLITRKASSLARTAPSRVALSSDKSHSFSATLTRVN